jgi:hypothetical protein
MTNLLIPIIVLALIIGAPIVLRLLLPGGCGWNVIECEAPEDDGGRRIS